MSVPLISVIIITKNQKHYLQKTLKVLRKQIIPDFETIIVDSGSTDGALELYRKFPCRLVNLPSHNFSYANAFNQGAKKARGKILLRLSGDAIPGDRFFLQNMSQGIEDPKVAGICGSYVTLHHKSLEYKVIHLFLQSFKKRVFFKQPFPITGGCLAIKKSLWQKHHFNETIGYGEDLEWLFWALKQRLGFIYEPKAWAYHEHSPKSLRALWEISLPVTRLCFRLAREYPGYFFPYLKLFTSHLFIKPMA